MYINNMTQETQAYNFILDNELTTQDALDLALAVGGNDMDTYNYIIYYFTAFHDIEQLWDCARDEFYFSDDVIDVFGLEE